MGSSLLFSLHGKRGIVKERGNKNKFVFKIKDVSDRVTWFTDIPDREAGSENVEELINGWEDFFPDGNNPNAALEFDDNNGKSDVVVFEMSKPVYSSKRDTLKFKAKINDNQALDGPLKPHSILADENFTKKFTSSSLFIDNAVVKDSQLTITNHFDEDIILRPLEFSKDGKTASDWIISALGAAATTAAGAIEFAVSAAGTGTGVVGPLVTPLINAATSAGLAEGAAIAVGVAGAVIGVAAPVFATIDALQTNYSTYVDEDKEPIEISSGESFTIRNSDSRWGISNGVSDIAFLVTTKPSVDPITGEGIEPSTTISSAGIIGSVFIDNPAVGAENARIVPWDGITDPVPPSINQVDKIGLFPGRSIDIDFKGGHMTLGRQEDSGVYMFGSKNWTLDLFADQQL